MNGPCCRFVIAAATATALAFGAVVTGQRSGSAASGVQFTDITRAAGVDFHHVNGGSPDKHLVETIDELTALGIAFTSLNEGIDTSTPAGTFQLHILAALAQFERARIVERVRAGMARAA